MSSDVGNFNQTGSIRITRKTLAFILLAGAVLSSGPGLALYVSAQGNEELASGVIIPLGNIWFVISNWICANASYLYGKKHLPLWFIVVGWFGLAGGGSDHLIEVFSYYSGNHQPFADHWVDMTIFGLPMVWFPFVAFGVTSIMGIWGMVYVFLRYAPNASIGAKIFFGLWALLGGLWGLVLEPALMPHSTLSWYTTHIFVTHALLSMLPVYIVWLYASHINVFSIVPRPAQGVGVSVSEPVPSA